MRIREDAWLGEVLRTPTFSVEELPAVAAGAAIEVAKHAAARSAGLYYAKLDTARVDLVRELGHAGFSVVDVNVTLERKTDTFAPAADPRVEVRESTTAEGERLIEIAGTSFRYSRFHLDPSIARDQADAVKREWVRSYVRGIRGDALLVATSGGEPVGFLAALSGEDSENRTAVLDLIGVLPEKQGRGVGRALVAAFVSRYSETHERLRVGTQVANVPSLALYARCGFVVTRTQYVMHWHVAGER